MKIIWFLLLFVATLFAHNVSPRLDDKLDHVTLQLHWKYQFEFAGFIAAKEKGFYRDEGLDVEFKEYQNGINIIHEVISGKANYGIYNSSTLIEYLKGKPIVLVASFFKRAALILITKPEIKSPKDLLHKRVMCTSKEDMLLNFGPYFQAYGVRLNSFKYIPHTFSVEEFAAGKVDAMTAYISDQPHELDRLGIKYNILDPSKDNLFTLQEELFTSKEELQKHPQRVAAFRRASIKGWQYALSHKQELVDIIHKKYAPNISKEALLYEAKAIDKLILPYIYDIGSIDVNFLRKQARIYKKMYKIGKDKTLNAFLFDLQKNSIEFTDEEKAYIQKHKNKPLKMCINYDFLPVDGVENGKYVGMMADFYKEISKKTGLEFQPVPSQSEMDLFTHLKEHKCDLISITATNVHDFTMLQTTRPMVSTHFTLISKLDKSFIHNPHDLKNKLLIVDRQSYKNYLNYLYPYVNIEVEPDKRRMLAKILTNRAYAIVTVDEKADYFIDKYGYGKLKINGFLAKEHELEASVGVQKDEPVLFAIMQKTLDTIPQTQLQNIMARWRLSRYHTVVDYTLVMAVGVGMSIILLIMIYYQRKLKGFNRELEKSVAAKTKELREINDSLEVSVQEKINELLHKDKILTQQSRQAVMGEMISMIAHQWRQPLNTIALKISNIELKEMISHATTKEELLEVLKDINTTVQYLSETIDDFKTYFQPNKESTQTTLCDLLQKSVGFIDARVKKENIMIDMTQVDDITLHVYENELIQVILNILNNAIDAYVENNIANERRITMSGKKKGANVEIIIEDNAGGITPETQEKLFEPYFSTKGKNGTGLGLYMSKMILEKQFSGTISVWSKEGKTRFILEIPLDVREK
jgi:signal transduction histidine kinase/ABC-type nitrate/sulfonate/bicarbonate transport system substrate-binding protein